MAKCLPTWADISVSVSVAILWVLCHFVGALVGLIPDFLDREKKERRKTLNAYNVTIGNVCKKKKTMAAQSNHYNVVTNFDQ